MSVHDVRLEGSDPPRPALPRAGAACSISCLLTHRSSHYQKYTNFDSKADNTPPSGSKVPGQASSPVPWMRSPNAPKPTNAPISRRASRHSESSVTMLKQHRIRLPDHQAGKMAVDVKQPHHARQMSYRNRARRPVWRWRQQPARLAAWDMINGFPGGKQTGGEADGYWAHAGSNTQQPVLHSTNIV